MPETDSATNSMEYLLRPGVYALATFMGAGLATMVAELPRFQTMPQWKVGLVAMMGVVLYLTGVTGLLFWGEDDAE